MNRRDTILDFPVDADRYLAGDLSPDERRRVFAAARCAEGTVFEEALRLEALLGQAFQACVARADYPDADDERTCATASVSEKKTGAARPLTDDDTSSSVCFAPVDISPVDLLLAGMLDTDGERELRANALNHGSLASELADADRFAAFMSESLNGIAGASSRPVPVPLPAADFIDRYLAGDLTLAEQAEGLAVSGGNDSSLALEFNEARAFEALMRETMRRGAKGEFAELTRASMGERPPERSVTMLDDMLDRFLAGALKQSELGVLREAAADSPGVAARLNAAENFAKLIHGTLERAASGAEAATLSAASTASARRAHATGRLPRGTSSFAGLHNHADKARASSAIAGRSLPTRRPRFFRGRSTHVRGLGAAALLLLVLGGGLLTAAYFVFGSQPGTRVDPATRRGAGELTANMHGSTVNEPNTPRSVREPTVGNENSTPAGDSMVGTGGAPPDISPAPVEARETPDPDGAAAGAVVVDGTSGNTPDSERPPVDGASTNDNGGDEIVGRPDHSSEPVAPDARPPAPDTPDGARPSDTSVNGPPNGSEALVRVALDAETTAAVRDALTLASGKLLALQQQDGCFALWGKYDPKDAVFDRSGKRMKGLRVSATPVFGGALATNAGAVEAMLPFLENEAGREAMKNAVDGVVRLFLEAESPRFLRGMNAQDAAATVTLLEAFRRIETQRSGRGDQYRLPAHYQSVIERATMWLTRNQHTSGMWAGLYYGDAETKGSLSHSVGRQVETDVITTFSVARALDKAAASGEKVERDVWRRLARALLERQSASGPEVEIPRMAQSVDGDGFLPVPGKPLRRMARGWTHTGLSIHAISGEALRRGGTATAGAVYALLACRDHLARAERTGARQPTREENAEDAALKDRIDAALEDGFAWLARNHRLDGEPLVRDDERRVIAIAHNRYAYLRTLGAACERDARFLLGTRPWRVENAEALLEARDDGGWVDAAEIARAVGDGAGPSAAAGRLWERHIDAMLALNPSGLLFPDSAPSGK